MAIGATLGALFFESYNFILFTVMSVVVLGSLLVTIFRIEETYNPTKVLAATPNKERKGFIQNYLHVCKDLTFMAYAAAGLLMMAIEFQLTNYIGIRLANEVVPQSIGLLEIDGVKMMGFLQTENTVLVVLFAAFAANLIRRFPEKWVLYTGCLLYTVGYSVITTSSIPILLFTAMLIATVGEVIKVPIQQSFIGDIAPSHSRSSYMAVNGMTFQAARVLASVGVLAGTILPSWQMGLIAFLMGMTSIWLFHAIMPDLQARREAAEAETYTAA